MGKLGHSCDMGGHSAYLSLWQEQGFRSSEGFRGRVWSREEGVWYGIVALDSWPPSCPNYPLVWGSTEPWTSEHSKHLTWIYISFQFIFIIVLRGMGGGVGREPLIQNTAALSSTCLAMISSWVEIVDFNIETISSNLHMNDAWHNCLSNFHMNDAWHNFYYSDEGWHLDNSLKAFAQYFSDYLTPWHQLCQLGLSPWLASASTVWVWHDYQLMHLLLHNWSPGHHLCC